MNSPLCTPTVRRARVEIIPLIDVVFFLLATFVLYTLAMERIQAFELPLPQSVPGEIRDDTTLFVEAIEDGFYVCRVGREGPSETVAVEGLRPRLAEHHRLFRPSRVMVSSNERATFGAGVRALDDARWVRVDQISVETARAR